MGAPFVDWVHLFQRHNTHRVEGGSVFEAPLPVVASGVRITDDWSRPDGLIESYRRQMVSGSHLTAVGLSCDGSSVDMSGNVGRFGRPDNVFNLGWDETLAAANELCSRNGLPGFDAGEFMMKNTVSERDLKHGLIHEYTGGRLSEIHVTKNFHTGSSSMAREVIRWWASQSKARLRKGRLGDETVIFGGRASTYQIECYIKAPEMLAHATGIEAKAAMRQSEMFQWCEASGLVRIEVKARRGFLRDRGMNFVGGVTMENVTNLFDASAGFLLDAKPEHLARVADNLPRKLRKYALLWLSGHDLEQAFSRATVFRIAKDLRGYGLDVCTPRPRKEGADVAAELDALLGSLPTFQLVEASPPEWYDAASEWGRAA